MNQNLCALLTDDRAGRAFIMAVADTASFKADAQHLCGVVVDDPGKKTRATLPNGVRFDPPKKPSIESVLRQTALLGDHNKIILIIIGLLFASHDLRRIVRASTPNLVAREYFEHFHTRIENAKIGTQEEVRHTRTSPALRNPPFIHRASYRTQSS